jgi:TatA/E family protein of Tat protein translocase
MAGLTPAHLLIILVIALIVIGPGKLPEVGSAIGKSFREFQKATSGSVDPAAAPTAQQAPAGGQPVPVQQVPAQPIYPAPYAPTHAYLPSEAVYPAGPVYMAQPAYPAQAAAPAAPYSAPTADATASDPRVG